jgi:hypothetical protein
MKLLLCEGKDDQAVVVELCSHSNIPDLVVEPYSGRGNLERVVRALPIRPEFTRGEVESLAILIDAENDKEASFQKLANAVRTTFDLLLPDPGVFIGENPRIGGFVVCGSTGRGMLEDLCLESVNARPEYHCMELYFECLRDKTDKKDHHSKAKFKAWMASQTEFDLRVGLAAGQGYIPWESEAFTNLREFLAAI